MGSKLKGKLFVPKEPLYIDAVDLKTGKTVRNKILYFSEHETDLWLVESPTGKFPPLKVSGDHSLLVEIAGECVPAKPLQLPSLLKKGLKVAFFVNGKRVFVSEKDVRIRQIASGAKTYDFTVASNMNFYVRPPESKDRVAVWDTAMVVMPLTKEAQQELRTEMVKHIFSPATSKFHFELGWDAAYGLYMLTKDSPKGRVSSPQKYLSMSFDQLLMELVQKPELASMGISGTFKGKRFNSTVGRLLFNKGLPEWHKEFYDVAITKKVLFGDILDKIAKEEYFTKNQVFDTLDAYHRLMRAGAYYAMRFPFKINVLTDVEFKKQVKKLLDEAEKKGILEGLRTIDQIMEKLKEFIRQNNPEIYWAIEAGARGKWADVQQMFLTRGYVTDSTGRVIPKLIKSSLAEGLTGEEYFNVGYAARKGIVDRAINTAGPGYLLRRMALAYSRVILDTEKEDCGTDKCLELEITSEELAQAVVFKYTCDGKLITEPPPMGSKVKIRSVLYCKGKKVCKRCYGGLYKFHRSSAIGIIAAQSIGERIQQTTMKTFHTGGLAKISDFPKVIPDDAAFITQEGDKVIAKRGKKLELVLYTLAGGEEGGTEVTGEVVILNEGIMIYGGLIQLRFYTEDDQPVNYSFELSAENVMLEFKYDDIVEYEEGGQTFRSAILEYNPGDEVAQLWFTTEDISTKFQRIRRLFDGVNIPDELKEDEKKYLLTMFDSLKEFKLNITHFEIALSQLMRYKPDVRYPWRLFQDAPWELTPIKSVIFYDSPVLGIAFENVKKAIQIGLDLGRKQDEVPSPLEAILEGNPAELKEILKPVED